VLWYSRGRRINTLSTVPAVRPDVDLDATTDNRQQHLLCQTGSVRDVCALISAGIAVACSGTPTKPVAAESTIESKAPVKSGATIKGRLLLNGEPVREFGVAIMKTFVMTWHNAAVPVHSADGTFVLDGITSGTWDIVLVGPTFARELFIGKDFADGGVVDLGDIAVRRGHTIRGRITADDGQLVSDAKIEVGCLHMLSTDDPLTDRARGCYATRSGHDGAYAIENVWKMDPLGGSQSIYAASAKLVSLSYFVPERDITMDIVVRPFGRIEGRVTGPVKERDFVSAEPIHRQNPTEIGPVGGIQANGSFAVEKVPVGDYWVSVAFSRNSRTRVTVEAAKATNVTLTP
jgi:hypothetical protein